MLTNNGQSNNFLQLLVIKVNHGTKRGQLGSPQPLIPRRKVVYKKKKTPSSSSRIKQG